MISWLHHLFATDGFPNIIKYGGSWETWLIILFVAAKVLTLIAYLVFMVVFVLAARAALARRIKDESARIHTPRVLAFFGVSVFFDIVLTAVEIGAFWHPAYRFIGLLSFVSSLALMAAALKSAWALRLCVVQEGAK